MTTETIEQRWAKINKLNPSVREMHSLIEDLMAEQAELRRTLERIKSDAQYCYGKPFDWTDRLGKIANEALSAISDAGDGINLATNVDKEFLTVANAIKKAAQKLDVIITDIEISEYAEFAVKAMRGDSA